jgi:hypothetical protein
MVGTGELIIPNRLQVPGRAIECFPQAHSYPRLSGSG